MQILSDLIMQSLFLHFAIRRYDSIIKVIILKMLTSTTVARAVYFISMSFKKKITRTKCLKSERKQMAG